jgi:hypothetical protein
MVRSPIWLTIKQLGRADGNLGREPYIYPLLILKRDRYQLKFPQEWGILQIRSLKISCQCETVDSYCSYYLTYTNI